MQSLSPRGNSWLQLMSPTHRRPSNEFLEKRRDLTSKSAPYPSGCGTSTTQAHFRKCFNSLTYYVKTREHFLLACLLGISHHQRPGFLSYPSSHLVPYLRSRKYPRCDFPEMYEYRRVEPRITAKVQRAYRRYHKIDKRLIVGIRRSTVQNVTPPDTIDCFITSPPYMNALDYGRDNRLRNWILTGRGDANVDSKLRGEHGFRLIMTSYTRLISESLSTGGHAVFVVGDKVTRTGMKSPSETILEIMQESAPNMVLKETIMDEIPDIRRARRHASGVKRENILVYRRTK